MWILVVAAVDSTSVKSLVNFHRICSIRIPTAFGSGVTIYQNLLHILQTTLMPQYTPTNCCLLSTSCNLADRTISWSDNCAMTSSFTLLKQIQSYLEELLDTDYIMILSLYIRLTKTDGNRDDNW
jgi:hypothetical protein